MLFAYLLIMGVALYVWWTAGFWPMIAVALGWFGWTNITAAWSGDSVKAGNQSRVAHFFFGITALIASIGLIMYLLST